MKLFISLLLLTSLSALLARGGDRAGNGGDAIVCFSEAVTVDNYESAAPQSTELKDFWEYGQTINQYEINLEGDTYQQKVMFALERLKKVDELRATLLIKRFMDPTFFSLVTRAQLITVDDSNSIIDIRDNCIELQVAFQIKNPRMLQSKVLIDSKIFKWMDANHKAGLILHELLYEQDIINASAETSDKIRWFTYIISSSFMDELLKKPMPAESFMKLIIDNSLNYFQVDEKEDEYKNRVEAKQADLSGLQLIPANLDIHSSQFATHEDEVSGGQMIFSSVDSIDLSKDLQVKYLGKNVEYFLSADKERLIGEFQVVWNGQGLKSSNLSTSSKMISFDLKSAINLNNYHFQNVLTVQVLSNQKNILFSEQATLKDIKIRCLDQCTALFENEALISLKGEIQLPSGHKAVLVRIKNGFLAEVILAESIQVDIGGSVQSIQRVRYDGRFYGTVSVKKKAKLDLSKRAVVLDSCGKKRCLYKYYLGDM